MRSNFTILVPMDKSLQAEKQDATNVNPSASGEQTATNDSTGSSEEAAKERDSPASAIDIEQGVEEPSSVGRRGTFGQRLRKRLRTRSDFSNDAPPLKQQDCKADNRSYDLWNRF